MKLKLLPAAAAVLFLVPAAFSGTLTLTFDTYANPTVHVWLSRGATPVLTDYYVFVGKFSADNTGSDPIRSLPPLFDSYCVDLLHTFDAVMILDERKMNIRPMREWEQANVPNMSERWPWPQHDGYAQQAAAYLYERNRQAASADTVLQAALQLSLWEVLYEGSASFNVADGDIYFTSEWVDLGGRTVLPYAAEYLNQLQQAPLADIWAARALWLQTHNDVPDVRDAYTQDFIAPVPEPGTLVLFSSGVLDLVLVGLRRRR